MDAVIISDYKVSAAQSHVTNEKDVYIMTMQRVLDQKETVGEAISEEVLVQVADV